MLKVILSAAAAFCSTNIDYIVILTLIFATVKKNAKKSSIYLGYLVGSAILILISLLLADVLKTIPEAWILGLLGIIPILLGIKLLFSGDEEEAKVNEKLENSKRNLMITVVLITVAVCGSDNIAIYVPYFSTLAPIFIPVALLVFFIGMNLVFWLGLKASRLPVISKFLEKYSDGTTIIVYIALGIFILLENGTFSHFFG
ncbi:MAG: cadmium resistance transporter [Lactobacillales bacterium]|jgi:cadmium resistance transport/sequestration family protein|nr:cadmium resistance transporter [Lactobacillales bacterium]